MSLIVHVDNSGFFRKLMRVFLTELGLQSESYERGEDAINALLRSKVSCVITGLELPDMTGEELIQWIAKSGLSMTIIAVTGSGNDDRTKHLETLGVKGTIQKGGDWKEKLREYF
jgi:FixJ family two-component response regulator